MAGDATLPVRRAVLTRLKATAAVTSLVPAARILPPRRGAKPTWPFIGYSNVIETPFRASCLDGAAVRFRISCFAKDDTGPTVVGEEQAARIAGAVKAALDGVVLQLEGGGSAVITWLDTVSLPDGDEASGWIATARLEATVIREPS